MFVYIDDGPGGGGHSKSVEQLCMPLMLTVIRPTKLTVFTFLKDNGCKQIPKKPYKSPQIFFSKDIASKL